MSVPLGSMGVYVDDIIVTENDFFFFFLSIKSKFYKRKIPRSTQVVNKRNPNTQTKKEHPRN